MTPIEECNNNIRRYQNLKTKVRNVIGYLEKFENKSKEVSQKMDGLYLIDNEVSNLSKRLSSLDNDVHKTSNYLKYTIIPSIDSNINQLRKTKETLEAVANLVQGN